MRNASVAPMLLANEATATPSQKPNSAPAANVSTPAAGNENAVTTTYSPKNAASTNHQFSRWNSAKACCCARNCSSVR